MNGVPDRRRPSPTAELMALAKRAARDCPTRAITVREKKGRLDRPRPVTLAANGGGAGDPNAPALPFPEAVTGDMNAEMSREEVRAPVASA